MCAEDLVETNIGTAAAASVSGAHRWLSQLIHERKSNVLTNKIQIFCLNLTNITK